MSLNEDHINKGGFEQVFLPWLFFYDILQSNFTASYNIWKKFVISPQFESHLQQLLING